MALNAMELSIRELYVSGHTTVQIAAKLERTVAYIKHALAAIRRRGEDFPRKNKPRAGAILAAGSQGLCARYVEEVTDIDGDIEAGKRCPNCWILYPADCVPGMCVARIDATNSHLPVIGALLARMDELENEV